MGLLISFLQLLLHCAIIVLIAYAIVWAVRLCKIEIDANVYKVGQFIVALLIIIAVASWLSGVIGGPDPLLRYRFG